ncbi:MAG: preprotein translocase subunit SecG [Candidatus Harrisonbacteria bacterium CG10_big_fil_rev_8_21_14_0_10_38_8]|uniref:Protein-export membrane protein SecG n=1 Tax=Candidatus Harrisonbacteria bacterium CG10_big_fil_rev_8_21_14_0_10_38_8 TaxID=1974582 RepID=A0A2M6WK15_9BACT|nr:MAG: preprotein translocase subunit SecG [Candidatus Harrisonbacteria bacterium CG10_big_fil_rev_8_21_14_0_10_38_8]
MDILGIIITIIAVIIMILILLQERGEGGLGGFLGSAGGGGSFYQKRRGLEKIFFNLTIVLIILFVGLSILNLFV